MNEIKQIIDRTIQKVSIHRLNEKVRHFNHIDIPLISIKYRNNNIKVSRKRLRFYLDLIKIWYPLDYKLNNNHKSHLISQVFKCKCTEEDLNKLKSFKDITKKKVIIMNNENVKTIKRLRWRSRDNVQKNIIHFRN